MCGMDAWCGGASRCGRLCRSHRVLCAAATRVQGRYVGVCMTLGWSGNAGNRGDVTEKDTETATMPVYVLLE
jgi:hypothetical protein